MYKLAAGVGCLLLLLAAVMFVAGGDPGASSLSHQRLRVQQALAGSAPCVTCHTAVSETPRLALETGQAGSSLPVKSPYASAVHIQPNIKTENAHNSQEQRSIGARLLAVPVRDVTEYTDAVDQYVAVSAALNKAETLAAQNDALRALDAVERQVLALEQQANPYRLRAETTSPEPDPGAAADAPPMPHLFVALLASAIVMVPLLSRVRYRVIETWIRTPRFVRGGRRRGPPLGAHACVFSVEKERLRLWLAQSLFSFVFRHFRTCRIS